MSTGHRRDSGPVRGAKGVGGIVDADCSVHGRLVTVSQKSAIEDVAGGKPMAPHALVQLGSLAPAPAAWIEPADPVEEPVVSGDYHALHGHVANAVDVEGGRRVTRLEARLGVFLIRG